MNFSIISSYLLRLIRKIVYTIFGNPLLEKGNGRQILFCLELMKISIWRDEESNQEI